ncbi:hypothetical protein [Streptomyces indicus]|uniref:SAV-6107-like HEPN domain-containing protein n=1 Tax=Streptomyces indicus TaxID=417292 RepID=A0A1G8TYU1_9ACTN|nr:hypothetical protein [Streptomyces indicus]SDJ46682.1 hypothetical protein SAMN05421806_101535 [Streptomyces indicus]
MPAPSEVEALVREVRALPGPPADRAEAVRYLAGLKRVAARWAEILDEAQEAAAPFTGPRAEAALQLAFRRAEESYVELEVALQDCGAELYPR